MRHYILKVLACSILLCLVAAPIIAETKIAPIDQDFKNPKQLLDQSAEPESLNEPKRQLKKNPPDIQNSQEKSGNGTASVVKFKAGRPLK